MVRSVIAVKKSTSESKQDSLRTNLDNIKASLAVVLQTCNELPEEQLVDTGAVLRGLKTFIGELDESVSNRLKQYIEDHSLLVMNGVLKTAKVTVSNPMLLDNDAVKRFLGVRLSQYQIQSTRITLTYKDRII